MHSDVHEMCMKIGIWYTDIRQIKGVGTKWYVSCSLRNDKGIVMIPFFCFLYVIVCHWPVDSFLLTSWQNGKLTLGLLPCSRWHDATRANLQLIWHNHLFLWIKIGMMHVSVFFWCKVTNNESNCQDLQSIIPKICNTFTQIPPVCDMLSANRRTFYYLRQQRQQ